MTIEVNNIKFGYTSNNILDNVSFSIEKSQIVSIVGPNGTGKSTLIKCIDGLLNPSKGSIYLDGNNINKMHRNDIAKELGYVPQSSSDIFDITVLDMVLLGRRAHINWRSKNKDKLIALDALKSLGVENLAMKSFNKLSGGQQQKTIIARALAQEAKVLLLDEPTSSLDIKRQLEVMDVIESLTRLKGISSILSVHDLNLAARYSDKIIMMGNGKIVAAGKPLDVLNEDNIADVYGVEALIKVEKGYPYIIPIRSIDQGLKKMVN